MNLYGNRYHENKNRKGGQNIIIYYLDLFNVNQGIRLIQSMGKYLHVYTYVPSSVVGSNDEQDGKL